MSKIKALTSEHSIKEVAFSLNFAEKLSESDIGLFGQLKGTFSDDFPIFEEINAIEFKVGEDNQLEGKVQKKKGGAIFKSEPVEGVSEKILRAEHNFIAFNHLKYSRWESIWPVAKQLLSSCAELAKPSNPIVSVGLVYIDQFIFEGEDNEYKANPVFEESKYLSQLVFESGASWHIHQGWFDQEGSDNQRVLNRLNITATNSDREHYTTIDHSGVWFYEKTHANSVSLLRDGSSAQSELEKSFDFLHKNNHDLLGNLLNKDCQKKIKLNDV